MTMYLRLVSTFCSSLCVFSLMAKSPKTENTAPTELSMRIEEIKPKFPGEKINRPDGDVVGAIVLASEESYFPGKCGHRKALGGMVKVYEICYFGKGMKASEWESAFREENKTKSFKLKLTFIRGVGGKKVSAAFSESLNKTPSANKLEELERQKFLAWSSKLKVEKDSVMELTFNDGDAFAVNFFEKSSATTSSQNFKSDQLTLSKAVAAIWIGPKPLSEELKADLLKE